MNADTTPRRTRAADGTSIAWRSAGRDDAPAIVLMHSLGANGAMWAPQVPAFGANHRVVTLDTRGHRESDAPPGPYRLDELATDVLAVADEAGIERFHAVGLSLGGQMAMWLGAHAPHRVRSLVLADTGLRIGNDESWRARIEGVTNGGMRAVRDAVLARWFAPKFEDRHADWFAAAQTTFDAIDPMGYAACCAALRDTDLTELAGRITAPTLVICGDVDLATPPSEAERIHARIAGSELTILDDAGHLSNLDQPEAFTARVLEFLRDR
ncbi:MAG: 3-oxoadipate enol-lactonase [Ilumatobacteraceae bacterium]